MHCAKIAQLPLPTLVPLQGGAQARSSQKVSWCCILGDELPVSEKAQHLVAEEELGPMGMDVGDGTPHPTAVPAEPNRTFDVGARILTVKSFLSANAIRATDSIDYSKIDWCSTFNPLRAEEHYGSRAHHGHGRSLFCQ